MIERVPGRLQITSPMVMANAHELLAAGREVLQPGEVVFDFAGVAEADSSAIAVMLGWLRSAATLRADLRFANVPPGVRSLAELYGFKDLLPLA